MMNRPLALDFCRSSPPQRRPIGGHSPLCGDRRLSKFVEQRLCLFQIGGVQASGDQPRECLGPDSRVAPGFDRAAKLAVLGQAGTGRS